MVIFFIFITWFGWTQHIARKKLRQAYYIVDSIQVENLTNFDTVKFFSQEDKEREKYYLATDMYRAIERPYITRYLFLQIGTALLLGAMMFGCFSVAISDYFSGKMSVGDVTSIVALVSVLLPGLMLLANEWRNIMKYLTDLEPFFELMETPNTVIDKPDSTSVKLWSELTKSDPFNIQFNHITFHYPDREAIFDELSLVFHPGKSYGIVGRSGAGKTTLMKLLLRFYDLQS
jgi:ATP-binding cassette subfamily B protein